MVCRNTEMEMRELRRCGCDVCHQRYRELERSIYEARKYYNPPREYFIDSIRQQLNNPTIPTIKGLDLGMSDTLEIVVTKVEEPKNHAIKLLVDNLKSQQSTLSGTQTNIDYHKKQLKTFNDNKNAALKKIKELSAALKKLGHKEKE